MDTMAIQRLTDLAAPVLHGADIPWRTARLDVLTALFNPTSSTEERRDAWSEYDEASRQWLKAVQANNGQSDDVRLALTIDRVLLWYSAAYEHRVMLALFDVRQAAWGHVEARLCVDQLLDVPLVDALQTEYQCRALMRVGVDPDFSEPYNQYIGLLTQHQPLTALERAQVHVGVVSCAAELIRSRRTNRTILKQFNQSITSALSVLGTGKASYEIRRLRGFYDQIDVPTQ